MNILGIIAEFNPFHNGHLYLLQEALKSEQFSGTVCVMSGNFVQRGEPAFCNKWVRTQMALEAGADLVIEIPFCFAVRSAYYFARGAIQLLDRTGVITHLAFGSESGNLQELKSVSSLLANESPAYQHILKKQLSLGLSFPVARSIALQAYFGESVPDVQQIIEQPNNILGLEYLKVLEQEALKISPLTFARKGSGYNSKALSDYASASAIRSSFSHPEKREEIAKSMPAGILSLLEEEIRMGRAPITLNSMEQLILFKLRTTPLDRLGKICEISEGLENRIQKAATSCGNIEELRHRVKSKRYSLSRINRSLLYALMDLDAERIASFDEIGPQYLHILGFSSQGQNILQEMKNNSEIPILSRGSAVKALQSNQENPLASSMIDLDVQASNVYTLLYPNAEWRTGDLDFLTSPIRF